MAFSIFEALIFNQSIDGEYLDSWEHPTITRDNPTQKASLRTIFTLAIKCLLAFLKESKIITIPLYSLIPQQVINTINSIQI
jgi:hypothetical protein